MAQSTWEVKGTRQGNVLIEEVEANTQRDAQRKFEHLNPDYKAGRARRV